MTTEQAQAHLSKLEARRDYLQARIRRYKKRIVAANTELQELHGGFRGYGLIELARRQLTDAQRDAEDQTKPRVVWKVKDYGYTGDFVVTRVTKKTIFVRELGRDHEHRFRLDGASYMAHCKTKIDVELTFGRDLKGTK